MTRTLSRAGGAALLALASLLVLVPSAGRAQVPQTLGYQGSLTDAAGTPVTGPVDMTFSLYDSPNVVGATLLWQEVQPAVPVTNGAFDVILGADALNPLPAAAFENPLWLGVAAGGDAEMAPRQALSAAGYGIRAKTVEVDTLNALGCAEGEVAKFAGGVWTCAVDATGGLATDLDCTGCVAEGELGFDPATQGELDTHAGDAAAHHGRYTDGEAVAAVGPHVTSVDGLGGGAITTGIDVAGTVSATGLATTSTALVTNLNADRLDDLQASEIVAAAQDEVRMPISALPIGINSPGSYYVTGDLTSTGSGITVNVDNVTIDLMGYSLIGPGSGTNDGVVMGVHSNVEVRNGTIRNFGRFGVQGSAGASHGRIVGVRIVGNLLGGLGVGGGIGHEVIGCVVADNGGIGISLGDGATVAGNTVRGNNNTGISVGSGSTLRGNTVEANGANGITTGPASTVMNNTAFGNGATGISASFGSTVIGNAARENTDVGIQAGSGATLSDNTTQLNGGDGFVAGAGVTVRGNSASLNGGDGINVGAGSMVANNSAFSNQNDGIDVAPGNTLVIANTAFLNDQSVGGFQNITVSCGTCTFVDNHAP